MGTHPSLTICGLTIDLTQANRATITLTCDGSVITIPYRNVGGNIIGTVPPNSPGNWKTLSNKTCIFTAKPVPNWWSK